MSRRHAAVVLALAGAIASLALALGLRSLDAARARAEDARSRSVAAAADVGRLLELRARTPRVSLGRQPSQDVYQRVNATLSASGLARVRAQNVAPSGEREVGGASGLREQSVRIELAPLTPDELGAFLARWQADHPVWTVTAIELTLQQPGAAGDYRATLAAASLYIDDAPPDGRTAR